jgi:hypothetical protein
MPTFCSSCGAALADRVAFCSACGTPTELGRTSGALKPSKPSGELQYTIAGDPISPTEDASVSRIESPVLRRRTSVRGPLLVGAAFVLLFVVWSSLQDSPTKTSTARQDKFQQGDSYTPPLQKSFTSMIESFIPSYNSADTEVRKTNVRFERRGAIVRYFSGLGNLRFQGWLGEVHDLSTERDGKASLTIKLKGSETVIGTWNNSLSDSFSDTMISRTDSLYPSLMEIRNGDEVTVSGTFVVGGSGQDYVSEMSLTEAGSMTSPEFVVRFSQIGKGSVHTSVAVPRRTDDTPPQVPEMSRPATAADDRAVGARDDWKRPYFDLEANLTHSLADAPLTSGERAQIYKVIDDASFADSHQREKPETVMSARVGSVGLAKDGSQQILVELCEGASNCSMWIFIRRNGNLRRALETEGIAFIVRDTSSHGFHDVATGHHMSFNEEIFSVYRWNGTQYAQVDCYDAAELDSTPPLITDCKK